MGKPDDKPAQKSGRSGKDMPKGHPFQPGQSGNPGGRPRIPDEVKEAFRAQTQQALDTLIEVMTTKKYPPSARVRAAEVVLDRGWGKVAQPVTGDSGEGPIKIGVVYVDDWRANGSDG